MWNSCSDDVMQIANTDHIQILNQWAMNEKRRRWKRNKKMKNWLCEHLNKQYAGNENQNKNKLKTRY